MKRFIADNPSSAQRRAASAKRVAAKWLQKYRMSKIVRMEKARQEYESTVQNISGKRESEGSVSFAVQNSVSASASGTTHQTKIMQEKLKHKLTKQKQKEKAERRKLVKKQKRLEADLEYINFPSIMGWYFDGFFTPHFYLNETYATIFNELEVGVARKKELSLKETFTEMTRRNFWPPEYVTTSCFRTRGVYMDHNETIRDPPHTPPKIDFEYQGETMMGVQPTNSADSLREPYGKKQPKVKFVDSNDRQIENDEDYEGEYPYYEEGDITEDESNVNAASNKKKKGRRKFFTGPSKLGKKIAEEERWKAIKKTDFYFDDEKAEFFKRVRKDQDKYYFDLNCGVWRIKRTPTTYASDFYYDSAGMFLPKDRQRKESDYVFDHKFACYRLASQVGKTRNDITPLDFFFDGRVGKWKKKTSILEKHRELIAFDGARNVLRGDNPCPDDFFFDFVKGDYVAKNPSESDLYMLDEKLGVWTLKDPPESEGPMSSQKPNYYYWDEKKFLYKKKNAPSVYFAYDSNNKIFRMKKSLVGKFSPNNWRWDDTNKKWFLPNNSRSGYFTEILHWRPDRDYDKPWLEYVGGYTDYVRYGSLNEEDRNEKQKGSRDKESETRENIDKRYPSTMRESESGASSTTNADKRVTERHAKIINPKDDLAPLSKDVTAKKKDTLTPQDNSRDSLEVATEAEKAEIHSALTNYDRYEHKILKIDGLGFIVNEVDLKTYLASASKVLRPKIGRLDVNEDFALAYFLSDEAAAAAMKVMNKQKIKGQTLHIRYCTREEKKIFEHRIRTTERLQKLKFVE